MDRPSCPPAPANSFARRLAPALLAVLALGALAGCQDEAIRHYKVPRVETAPTRLLGAIAPVGEKVWFFKLTGPAPLVAKQQAAFDQFIRSLHFQDNAQPLITWTAPEGWEQQPGGQLSYASFRIAGGEGLNLTVTPLDRAGQAGDLLANVNRWRGQLNLQPITEAELKTETRTAEVNGHTITLVDMTGSGAGGMAAANPKSQIPNPKPESPAAGKPLTYDVPAGWEEIPASGFRAAAFRVRDGERSAEVTVIPLAGAAGGLLSNVNRWRQQIGLGAITEAQLQKDAKPIRVADATGFFVDMVGPESAGAGRQRTLGAVLLPGGRSWFVKLQGPAELVAKQQAAFETFVKSLRFGAAGGES
jgi:hypothetical protein